MTNPLTKEIATPVIATNIGCMKTLLANALQIAEQADEAMTNGERNLAIGTLHEMEGAISNLKALYDATIFMHRNGR